MQIVIVGYLYGNKQHNSPLEQLYTEPRHIFRIFGILAGTNQAKHKPRLNLVYKLMLKQDNQQKLILILFELD